MIKNIKYGCLIIFMCFVNFFIISCDYDAGALYRARGDYTGAYLANLYYKEYITGIIIISIIFAIIGSIIAFKKGRSVIGWLVLCGLFWVIPIIVIAALPNLNSGNYSNNYYRGNSPSKRNLKSTEVKCKSCGSIVEAGYKKCPHCAGELTSENNSTINLSNISAIRDSDNYVVCPFCKNKMKLNISIKEFKNIICNKCNKKITKTNVIFED